MHEAVFRITHHSVYANATDVDDVSLHMWCGRHADLLHLSGRDVETALDHIRNEIELADVLEEDGEVVAVTRRCLLSHQDNLLEKHLQRHNCLTFYPVSYSDGQMLTRVISLEKENLSAFYHSIQTDFDVEVVSIRDIEGIEQYPALLFNADLPDFSQRQREAISRAFEMGYYQIPRETTTAEVAAELDINRRTFEEHLRRAEKKAVESLLNLTDM